MAISAVFSVGPVARVGRPKAMDFVARLLLSTSVVYWMTKNSFTKAPYPINYYNLFVLGLVLTSFWFFSERLYRLCEHRVYALSGVLSSLGLWLLAKSMSLPQGLQWVLLLAVGLHCIFFIGQLVRKGSGLGLLLSPFVGMLLGGAAINIWINYQAKLPEVALALTPIWVLLPMGWVSVATKWKIQMLLVFLVFLVCSFFLGWPSFGF